MKKQRLSAVLDANLLYSAAMRDFFMRLATHFVFQPKWTNEIHEEWMEAVLENRPDIPRAMLERTRDLMNRYGNDWEVPPYQHLIPLLNLKDPDDRHVLAAAIASKTSVIITLNLSDFPTSELSSHGIRAVGPDAYACELFREEPDRFLKALRAHRASLKNPPKSPEEYLDSLAHCGLIQTAQQLHDYLEDL